jgi:hypothetical protein
MALCISELAPVREESVRRRIRQATLKHDVLLAPLAANVRDTLRNSLRLAVGVFGISDLR